MEENLSHYLSLGNRYDPFFILKGPIPSNAPLIFLHVTFTKKSNQLNLVTLPINSFILKKLIDARKNLKEKIVYAVMKQFRERNFVRRILITQN